MSTDRMYHITDRMYHSTDRVDVSQYWQDVRIKKKPRSYKIVSIYQLLIIWQWWLTQGKTIETIKGSY